MITVYTLRVWKVKSRNFIDSDDQDHDLLIKFNYRLTDSRQ